jgi:acyl CoA:acetate/3-ketoacid CoA transferase
MPGVDAEHDIVQTSGGRISIAENATAMPQSLLSIEPMGLKL